MTGSSNDRKIAGVNGLVPKLNSFSLRLPLAAQILRIVAFPFRTVPMAVA
jgi:hypothetical protein